MKKRMLCVWRKAEFADKHFLLIGFGAIVSSVEMLRKTRKRITKCLIASKVLQEQLVAY